MTYRTQQYRSDDAEKNPGATERRELSNDGASRHGPGDDRRIPDDARTTPRVFGDAFADRASQTVETFGQGQLIPMAPRWATAACGSGQQQWIVIQPQVP